MEPAELGLGIAVLLSGGAWLLGILLAVGGILVAYWFGLNQGTSTRGQI